MTDPAVFSDRSTDACIIFDVRVSSLVTWSQGAAPGGEGGVEALRNQIQAQRAEKSRDVHLHLGEVRHVDSTGLGLLMYLYQDQRKKGKKFLISPCHPQLRDFLKGMNLEFILGEEAAA